MITIALDAMGGDYAPKEIIKGAIQAIREYPVFIILVGQEEKVKEELKKYKKTENIAVLHASQVIGMDESPATAVKQKREASINVAVSSVKMRKAQAVVSAGNTGALMASALFQLGRVKGIERPAIATIFPTQRQEALLLDMGANVDCKPKHLLQFAEMGSLYAERVMHRASPKVGLLNIGEEAEKGNELTSQTYPLLKKAPINFIGNIEGKDILAGHVDVIVCDGFVGNMILKFAESVSQTVFSLINEELNKHPLFRLWALFLSPVFVGLRRRIEYEELGGAPLLGINGVCIKAHGRAKAKAIKNAIRVAAEAVKENMVESFSKIEE